MRLLCHGVEIFNTLLATRVLIDARPPHTQTTQWVKAHASQDGIASGRITEAEKEANSQHFCSYLAVGGHAACSVTGVCYDYESISTSLALSAITTI